MTAQLQRYTDEYCKEHGWEINLACSECGWTGVPRYGGWTSDHTMDFGSTHMVYADLDCYECGNKMREEAGKKLIEFFRDVPVDLKNKVNMGFLILAVTVLLIIPLSVIPWGVSAGLWGWKAYLLILYTPMVVIPSIMLVNTLVGPIDTLCECGEDYQIMGMLGRSYCYRCVSCGDLRRSSHK